MPPEVNPPAAGPWSAWFLAGPTAVGKTTLAHRLAREMNAAILCADAMTVYRDLDIGTAKPSPAERSEVTYHGLDWVAPEEEFSVGAYLERARAVLAAEAARGRPLIVVGGTGLYLRCLLCGLRPAQQPHDRTWGPVAAQPELPALHCPRPRLHARIEARVAAMYRAGLLDECARLRARTLSRTARQAIGYREALAVLAGTCTLAEAQATTVLRTRQYAKRQVTWLRHQHRTRWFDADAQPTELAAQIRRFWETHGPCPIRA